MMNKKLNRFRKEEKHQTHVCEINIGFCIQHIIKKVRMALKLVNFSKNIL